MKKNYLIPILLISICAIWGGSFVVVKVIVDEIASIQLGFLRFLVATPIMFLLILLQNKKVKIPLKEFPSLVVLGLTGVTLIYIFQYIGIEYTTASTSSALININVIFIALLSSIFLKEYFSFKKTLGITLSFVGVIVIILSQSANEQIEFNSLFLLGSLFILLSAFCWAIYSIVGKKLLKRYDSLTVISYAFLLGTIFYIPFILSDFSNFTLDISFNGWLSIFYISILCSVFGYVGWYYALNQIEASKAAVFLNTIPLFGIVISYFITKEIPTYFFLIGAILIIYGVYITQKTKDKKARQ